MNIQVSFDRRDDIQAYQPVQDILVECSVKIPVDTVGILVYSFGENWLRF